MKKKLLNYFVCPETKTELKLKNETLNKYEEVKSGLLVNNKGNEYKIQNGIPSFLMYSDIEKNNYAINLFKEKAISYDQYQHLSFETFYQNETDVRNSMIDKLELKPNSTVLEVNAGTGRDSVLIAKRLSSNASFHIQDISMDMLMILKEKMADLDVPTEINQSNACKLPYTDDVFDAVYSFGGVGMNTYANNKEVLAEIVRVTKPGGKVVIGGLSLAPWLHSTTFGKILINHNPHYANEINFTDLPIEAREFNLSWILSGAGFVIDFKVGKGEPDANFDYEIPGVRGGTHKTRFYGQLEGVTADTKELAFKAREKTGLSMHKWLDDLVKREAKKILNGK